VSWISIRIACWSIATIALASVATSGTARAVTVPAGDTLQIAFNLAGPATVPGCCGPLTGSSDGLEIDTLAFLESDAGTFSNGVAKLFNGSTLLGTVNFSTGFFETFAFAAPGSQYTFGPIGQVPSSDWSAFVNGTINGILDITFSQTIDITVFVDDLGVGNGNNGILNADEQPNITSVSVLSATPLPATLPLLASGVAFIGYLARRRKQSGQRALAT